jgi:predicted permease
VLLLQLFADNLLPAFLAAGAGALLAAKGNVPVAPFSRAAFWVFSPCLLYTLVERQQLKIGQLASMGTFVLVSLLSLALLAWLVARLLRWNRSMTAALVLVVMLPNAGNLGLAMNLFAFGEAGLAQAGLFFVVSALLSYSAGALVVALGKTGWAESLKGVLGVPAIWAAALAFLLVGTGFALPLPLHRAVTLLGDASIPIFLLVLGMQLVRVNWHAKRGPVLLAVGLRLVASAAVAFLAAHLLGLEGAARQAGIFQAAMPTAVITSILATEYDAESDFVSATVFATTVLSPLTLTPLLYVLGARTGS